LPTFSQSSGTGFGGSGPGGLQSQSLDAASSAD